MARTRTGSAASGSSEDLAESGAGEGESVMNAPDRKPAAPAAAAPTTLRVKVNARRRTDTGEVIEAGVYDLPYEEAKHLVDTGAAEVKV